MVGILFDYDAIVDKFIGDAIVARFDSGDRKVDDARNAVFAAWHMNEKLKEFNLDSFEEVQSQVGIAGNVILGNLGCERHRLESMP